MLPDNGQTTNANEIPWQCYRNNTKIERHSGKEESITFTFFHRHSKSLSQKKTERGGNWGACITRNRFKLREYACLCTPRHRQLLHYISTTSRVPNSLRILYLVTFAKTSFKTLNTRNTSTFKRKERNEKNWNLNFEVSHIDHISWCWCSCGMYKKQNKKRKRTKRGGTIRESINFTLGPYRHVESIDSGMDHVWVLNYIAYISKATSPLVKNHKYKGLLPQQRSWKSNYLSLTSMQRSKVGDTHVVCTIPCRLSEHFRLLARHARPRLPTTNENSIELHPRRRTKEIGIWRHRARWCFSRVRAILRIFGSGFLYRFSFLTF